jgi:hypothetical protein
MGAGSEWAQYMSLTLPRGEKNKGEKGIYQKSVTKLNSSFVLNIPGYQ